MIYFNSYNLTPWLFVLLLIIGCVVGYRMSSSHVPSPIVKNVIGYEIDIMKKSDGTFYNDTVSIIYKQGNTYTLEHSTKEYRK